MHTDVKKILGFALAFTWSDTRQFMTLNMLSKYQVSTLNPLAQMCQPPAIFSISYCPSSLLIECTKDESPQQEL